MHFCHVVAYWQPTILHHGGTCRQGRCARWSVGGCAQRRPHAHGPAGGGTCHRSRGKPYLTLPYQADDALKPTSLALTGLQLRGVD
jgi:hypothetical protein